MAEGRQTGASNKPWWWEWFRLALEAVTVGALIVSVVVYWRMSNTYEAQLAEMQKTNEGMLQERKAAADARSEDSAQHAKERAEDAKTAADAKKTAEDANKRANDVTKRLLEIQGKLDTVRSEIISINSAFVESFDGAVTSAYKNISNNNDKLKDFAQSILEQRKILRNKAAVVQENMTIITQALDSLIDELDHEINTTPLNAERVKTLIRMIYEEKSQIEARWETL
jgi:DNA repair exonuclease SbcCD ATPase subunit